MKKEETAKPETSKASNDKLGLSFADKMKKMNELFKNHNLLFYICLNISQYSLNKFHIMFIFPASSVGISFPNIFSSSYQLLILSLILLIIPDKFSRIILNNIFVDF